MYSIHFISLIAYILSLWMCQTDAVTVKGIKVHPVPLRRIELPHSSPFCYAVSSAVDVMDTDVNFLATQVWPSARLAATMLEYHLDKSWTVCEFGCGPGLPSLTAAKLGAERVCATDLDPFALDMVKAAAKAQRLSNIETVCVDLTNANEWMIPDADLYLLSDVFESSVVARGSARVIDKLLRKGARVWVFAQTDRAQREVFLGELQMLQDESDLKWQSVDEYDPKESLWLCNVDESKVLYG